MPYASRDGGQEVHIDAPYAVLLDLPAMIEADDQKLIRNERTKLTATWLNSIAVGAIVVGGIAPPVAVFTTSLSPWTAIGLVLTWFAVGTALHSGARHLLGGLRS